MTTEVLEFGMAADPRKHLLAPHVGKIEVEEDQVGCVPDRHANSLRAHLGGEKLDTGAMEG
jgi:hypothetical protein